jgi:hypothetical protein
MSAVQTSSGVERQRCCAANSEFYLRVEAKISGVTGLIAAFMGMEIHDGPMQ